MKRAPREDFDAAVGRVRRASRFVDQAWARNPGWRDKGALSQVPDAATLRAELAEDRVEDGDAAFMQRVRTLRVRELARIAFRDLAGWADFGETCEGLTTLAEVACDAALERAFRRLVERHGEPRDGQGRVVRPCILGMGKLGGRELNFSSDIDLICCYASAGETSSGLSNEEFFGRAVRDFTRLLAEPTGDGVAFRVDWMLRPFGKSGPPAISFDAMEEYYQVHGREWERYAMIKARPVAGDLAGGQRMLQRLRPFVYRRYLDFNAVGALRELKRKIDEEVRRKDLRDNVKLGSGGIREVEFVVQSFQLMRGGPEPPLRGVSLRPVLRRLGEVGHLPARTAAELDDAYVYLRRLENAIQMYADEQTHRLPAAEEARTALCAALEADSWKALEQGFKQVRARVHAEFRRLFAEPETPAARTRLGSAVSGLWSGDGDVAEAVRLLAAEGFGESSEGVAQRVRSLRRSLLTRTLSEASARGLRKLVALILTDAAGARQPGAAATRMLDVVAAVSGRATYLTLLRESTVARSQLLKLCDASAWVANLIERTPLLLDQLLDVRTLYSPPDRAQMQAELDALLSHVELQDVEGAMNVLRTFQQEVTLRVAAADVVEALPLVKVSDRLTWLAEVIVETALARVRASMREQYGEPLRADGTPVAFAVVAYGKFGSIEMGYGSDLDIIFLHDCTELQEETEGGPRSLPNEAWLSRLAQRVIHWLTTRTGVGRAYEVDLELRPEGRRGLTVSSMDAFEAYQTGHAWVWEHQALTRARSVAGPAALRERFERMRRTVLCRPRDADALRREVAAMRARMRRHQDKSNKDGFDVKHGRGGLTDIEFIVQYLLLREAHRHVALTEWPDIWRQLEALGEAGVLEPQSVERLLGAQRAYREFLHRCSLDEREARVPADQFASEREGVSTLWDRLLPDPPAQAEETSSR